MTYRQYIYTYKSEERKEEKHTKEITFFSAIKCMPTTFRFLSVSPQQLRINGPKSIYQQRETEVRALNIHCIGHIIDLFDTNHDHIKRLLGKCFM